MKQAPPRPAPLRVVHVVWAAAPGGIERLIIDLCRTQARGDAVTPAILFGHAQGMWLETFEALGVPLYDARLRSGTDFSPFARRRARAIFENYDLLHFHSFNPLLASAAVGSARPVVYTEHGNFGFGRKRRWRDRLQHRLKRHFLRRSVAVMTCNSNFTRDVARARYGLDRLDTRVVYNGIDHSQRSEGELDPELAQLLADRFVVGYVGRLAGFKRVDRLLRAFADFRHRRSGYLLLVGDGVERSRLERLAADLGIREDCIFAGFRSDVGLLQRRMDVCACPSEGEPFGLVAVEALSRGTPVVVFEDGGGVIEIVGGVRPDDVVTTEAAMARRFEHYLVEREAPDDGRLVGHARTFDIRTMAGQLLDVYRQVSEDA